MFFHGNHFGQIKKNKDDEIISRCQVVQIFGSKILQAIILQNTNKYLRDDGWKKNGKKGK